MPLSGRGYRLISCIAQGAACASGGERMPRLARGRPELVIGEALG